MFILLVYMFFVVLLLVFESLSIPLYSHFILFLIVIIISFSTINAHKKQVNCCTWNNNGNWLASGSMDGLIKLYDIRTMKELETWRGQNSEVNQLFYILIF